MGFSLFSFEYLSFIFHAFFYQSRLGKVAKNRAGHGSIYASYIQLFFSFLFAGFRHVIL